MNIFAGVFGAVADLGKTWMSNKAAEKAATHDAKIKNIQNTAHWENKMADASANSWKDEVILVTLLLPVWLTFYGAFVGDESIIERVEHGFHALDVLPEWFSYLLFLACSASFGIRGADKLMKMRKK